MALPPIPPLNFNSSSSARSALDQNGSIFQASGDGDWVVNMGGAQMAGMSPLIIAAVVLGVAWLLLKK